MESALLFNLNIHGKLLFSFSDCYDLYFSKKYVYLFLITICINHKKAKCVCLDELQESSSVGNRDRSVGSSHSQPSITPKRPANSTSSSTVSTSSWQKKDDNRRSDDRPASDQARKGSDASGRSSDQKGMSFEAKKSSETVRENQSSFPRTEKSSNTQNNKNQDPKGQAKSQPAPVKQKRKANTQPPLPVKIAPAKFLPPERDANKPQVNRSKSVPLKAETNKLLPSKQESTSKISEKPGKSLPSKSVPDKNESPKGKVVKAEPKITVTINLDKKQSDKSEEAVIKQEARLVSYADSAREKLSEVKQEEDQTVSASGDVDYRRLPTGDKDYRQMPAVVMRAQDVDYRQIQAPEITIKIDKDERTVSSTGGHSGRKRSPERKVDRSPRAKERRSPSERSRSRSAKRSPDRSREPSRSSPRGTESPRRDEHSTSSGSYRRDTGYDRDSHQERTGRHHTMQGWQRKMLLDKMVYRKFMSSCQLTLN